mmetsp:Transcript_123180/g.394542  ORF Transcript_123180/g.394542 Transcript_123180/m.394542 type:complete len:304 (+) Transcript_123180:371-1282(+)
MLLWTNTNALRGAWTSPGPPSASAKNSAPKSPSRLGTSPRAAVDLLMPRSSQRNTRLARIRSANDRAPTSEMPEAARAKRTTPPQCLATATVPSSLRRLSPSESVCRNDPPTAAMASAPTADKPFPFAYRWRTDDPTKPAASAFAPASKRPQFTTSKTWRVRLHFNMEAIFAAPSSLRGFRFSQSWRTCVSFFSTSHKGSRASPVMRFPAMYHVVSLDDPPAIISATRAGKPLPQTLFPSKRCLTRPPFLFSSSKAENKSSMPLGPMTCLHRSKRLSCVMVPLSKTWSEFMFGEKGCPLCRKT